MQGQPVDGQVQPQIPAIWLSISDLAAIKKVSKAAISKRVIKLEGDGLLTTRVDGKEKKVNLVEFDRAIGATTDPAQALRNPTGITQPQTVAPAAEADEGGAGSDPSYNKSKALRESYQAEGARLDLEERTGRLADKDEVEARTFRIFRRVRDRFLSLPAIATPRVRAAADDRTAQQVLDEEVRKVLESLAADLDRKDEPDDDEAEGEELSDVASGDRAAP